MHCGKPKCIAEAHDILNLHFPRGLGQIHHQGNLNSWSISLTLQLYLSMSNTASHAVFLLLHCILQWHPISLYFLFLPFLNRRRSWPFPPSNESRQQSSWSFTRDILRIKKKKEKRAGLNKPIAASFHFCQESHNCPTRFTAEIQRHFGMKANCSNPCAHLVTSCQLCKLL